MTKTGIADARLDARALPRDGRHRARAAGAADRWGVTLLRPGLALAVMSLGMAAFAGRAGGPQEEMRTRGKELYRVYCQNCHGEGGEGDGPMVKLLTVRPADLTRIAAADGTFPFERTYLAIDGRLDVRGHGTSEMPVWGLSFRDRGSDVDQEDEVRGRILALIEYLRSIQKTRAGAPPPTPIPAPSPSPGRRAR